MDLAKTAAIDVVEVAYDLDIAIGDWLPELTEAARPLFDGGIGFYSALVAGTAPDGQHLITQMHLGAGPDDLPLRMWRAAQAAGPKSVAQWSQAILERGVAVMSELRDRWPDTFRVLTEHTESRDGLSINAIDPDAHGVSFNVPLPEIIELSPRQREQWKMLAVHMAAGYRLRRGLLEATGARGATSTDMPHNADALLDPSRFVVSDAAEPARDKSASEVIREAARRIDKARGRLRKRDPEQALETWHGLVSGRWSLVDWFDTDGRRFVLAKPNAPNLGDPRGLTEREHQVATYAALGESSKLIAYRFGVSRARVSTLLRDAMHKLGVKTQAQLVERMRGLPTDASESR